MLPVRRSRGQTGDPEVVIVEDRIDVELTNLDDGAGAVTMMMMKTTQDMAMADGEPETVESARNLEVGDQDAAVEEIEETAETILKMMAATEADVEGETAGQDDLVGAETNLSNGPNSNPCR